MDKLGVCVAIVQQLEAAVASALIAAAQARSTATDKENIAENKYDTLGLEAAYLAHGQSERVVQLSQSLDDFRSLSERLETQLRIDIGALVTLEEDNGFARHVFIGPSAGGELVEFEGAKITVITPESPLGKLLFTLACGDEVRTEIAGKEINYMISAVW